MSAILLILIPGVVLIAIGMFDAEIEPMLIAIAWFIWTISLLQAEHYL